MKTANLPADDLLEEMKEDVFSTRTRRLEFLLLTGLSLIATLVTITVFGTHVNTWYGALTMTVNTAGGR